MDALGDIVSAVGGRVDIFLDGGVRQGTDVLKALALGAKAVLVGRPVLWGRWSCLQRPRWSGEGASLKIVSLKDMDGQMSFMSSV